MPITIPVVGLWEDRQSAQEKTSPKEFLSWAESDLQGADTRSRGNALSNIKKALHSRLDEIIWRTHVRFSKGWDARRIGTNQKLEIMQELGVKHEAVIDLITSIRNDYEHNYTVPKLRETKAYLHAAQLWIEKSYSSYEFYSIGFADIPLSGIGTGKKKPNGSPVSFVQFAKRQRALYFSNQRESIITIESNGATSSVPYKSLTYKEMIKLEAPYIRAPSNGHVAVDAPSLDDLFDMYLSWLKSP